MPYTYGHATSRLLRRPASSRHAADDVCTRAVNGRKHLLRKSRTYVEPRHYVVSDIGSRYSARVYHNSVSRGMANVETNLSGPNPLLQCIMALAGRLQCSKEVGTELGSVPCFGRWCSMQVTRSSVLYLHAQAVSFFLPVEARSSA